MITISNDIYTPQQFGAIADGVNNDTNAIQQCFNQSVKRDVYIPSGQYLVDDTIKIPASVCVKMAAGATIRTTVNKAVFEFVVDKNCRY